jgi:aryl-alcohol dehydrogenase-like predicted oxidoreductase
VQQLDLVQLHWWDYSIPGMVDAALALAELREKGLVRHVGLTNMNTQAVAQIVDAGVPVVCNQVRALALGGPAPGGAGLVPAAARALVDPG